MWVCRRSVDIVNSRFVDSLKKHWSEHTQHQEGTCGDCLMPLSIHTKCYDLEEVMQPVLIALSFREYRQTVRLYHYHREWQMINFLMEEQYHREGRMHHLTHLHVILAVYGMSVWRRTHLLDLPLHRILATPPYVPPVTIPVPFHASLAEINPESDPRVDQANPRDEELRLSVLSHSPMVLVPSPALSTVSYSFERQESVLNRSSTPLLASDSQSDSFSLLLSPTGLSTLNPEVADASDLQSKGRVGSDSDEHSVAESRSSFPSTVLFDNSRMAPRSGRYHPYIGSTHSHVG